MPPSSAIVAEHWNMSLTTLGFLSVDPDRIATAGSGTDGNLRSEVSLACAAEVGSGSPYR